MISQNVWEIVKYRELVKQFMARDGLVLAIIIRISIANTAYSVFLVLVFRNPNISLVRGLSKIALGYPYTIFPISTGALGWLVTGYELFSLRRKDISVLLKKKFSRNKEERVLYDIFNGRGGARRLSI